MLSYAELDSKRSKGFETMFQLLDKTNQKRLSCR